MGRALTPEDDLKSPISLEDVSPLLQKWEKAKQEANNWVALERELRGEIFDSAFPIPAEGAKNQYSLSNGYVLKANHKISRNIDTAALQDILLEMSDNDPEKAKGFEDKLIRYRPELKVGAYKTLPEEYRHMFEQALTIKDGSPTLDIVAPKKKS